MTEYQDITATNELNTTNWYYVGTSRDDNNWEVFQTNRGELFAIDTNSDNITFEVYEEDAEFLVYW